MARRRPGGVAARAAAARRPGLRRRGPPARRGVDPLDARPEVRRRAIDDYEEYTQLYREAWGEPIDPLAALDGAQRDDLRRPRRPRRLEHVDRVGHRDARRRRGGAGASWPRFESYLIYQHLGNLSPRELRRVRRSTSSCATAEDADADELRDVRLARRRGGRGHALELLPRHRARPRGDDRLARRPRARAGRPQRWSTRDEWRWIEEHARGDVDHLLIGTSLPLFLAPGAALARGLERGRLRRRLGQACVKRLGEKLRQELDLEHWAAFGRTRSGACATCCREVGAGRARRGAGDDRRAARGDVHHAYLAEVGFPPRDRRAVAASGRRSARRSATRWTHNERRVILAGWTRAGGAVIARRSPAARRRARRRRCAGGSRTRSRGSTTRSRRSSSRAATPRSCSRRRAAARATERASPMLERVFERPLEPNRRLLADLRHASVAGGHDLVANRLEPLRTA